jgi:serine/threonine protein kinase HipA of HipAB toxin-antitoxin module
MLSNEEFKVYDFEAAKNMKKHTGRAVAWQVSPDEYHPETKKHDDEAMAIHDEPAKPDSKLTKAAKFIGLMDPLP